MKKALSILLLATLSACQNQAKIPGDTVAQQIHKESENVRFVTRAPNPWHENASWFDESTWPNRWVKVHFESASVWRSGATIFLGGNVKGESSTLRSALFVSTDGGKTWNEAEPIKSGSSVSDIQSDGKVASALVFWNSGDGAFRAYMVSRDQGHTWQMHQPEFKTDPQKKIGFGSYTHWGHRLEGKKFTVVLEGADKAAEFESRDGKTLAFKKMLSEKKRKELMKKAQENYAKGEEANKEYLVLPEAWLDWETGNIALNPPAENPPRQMAIE